MTHRVDWTDEAALEWLEAFAPESVVCTALPGFKVDPLSGECDELSSWVLIQWDKETLASIGSLEPREAVAISSTLEALPQLIEKHGKQAAEILDLKKKLSEIADTIKESLKYHDAWEEGGVCLEMDMGDLLDSLEDCNEKDST